MIYNNITSRRKEARGVNASLIRQPLVVVWHSSSTLVSINEVNLHRARLVLGWVTVSGFNSWCIYLGM